MLNKQEVAAIMPLASMLAERGVSLEVIPGTPVGNLTMASASIDPAPGDIEAALVAISTPYDTGRKDDEGAPVLLPSEHGFVKKRAVDCIAKGVMQMVTTARQVVIPAINATRADVDAFVDANAKVRSILPEVDVYNYDPMFGSALVDGIATQYDKVSLVGMPTVTLPDLSDEQLHALVNSGSQEVRDFIAREDQECPGHLSAIWHIWFQGSPVSNSDDFAFLSRMLTSGDNNTRLLTAGRLGDSVDTRKGYDAVLVAFLLANALYDNPVSGVAWNMDLARYNLTMSAFKAHFGKVIGRIYRARITAVEQKSLVINMPVAANWQLGERTDNVLLNGDVYKWYLENGGSIEAVIGNVFSDRVVSGRTILDLRPQFEASYTNVVNSYASLGVSNKHRFIMEALTASLVKHVQGIDAAYWAELNPDYTKQQMINDLRTYLASGLPIGSSDNLDKVITTAYTCFIYQRHNVDQFINAMNNYPDQTLSPKVIAAHVIMDMVIKSMMNDVYYKFQS